MLVVIIFIVILTAFFAILQLIYPRAFWGYEKFWLKFKGIDAKPNKSYDSYRRLMAFLTLIVLLAIPIFIYSAQQEREEQEKFVEDLNQQFETRRNNYTTFNKSIKLSQNADTIIVKNISTEEIKISFESCTQEFPGDEIIEDTTAILEANSSENINILKPFASETIYAIICRNTTVESASGSYSLSYEHIFLD